MTDIPNNPFSINGGGTKPQENTTPDANANANAGVDNPFSLSQNEQATMGNNPDQSTQPTPDLSGGTSMHNQAGGFNPNQGFGGGQQNQGFGGGQQNQGFGGGQQNQGFGGGQQNQGFGGGQQNPQGGFGGQQNNQGGFGGQQNNQGFGGGFQNNQSNNQQNNQQAKYVIVDFFWWINKKILKSQQLQQGETALLTVGYNASFNNLRFSFHNADNSTFSPSSITIQNAPRASMCNIYAEQALELLAYKGQGKEVHSFERVIKAGNWTPNQTRLVWNTDNITIQTVDNQGATYQFICVEEQILGLEKAFEFLINGTAWNISLQAVLNR